MTDNLQGRFAKYDGQWRAVMRSGEGRAAKPGDHVTLHKSNGDLKKVTLTKLAGKAERPDGSRLAFFRFTDGWGDVVDVEVEDWDGDETAKESSIYSRDRI